MRLLSWLRDHVSGERPPPAIRPRLRIEALEDRRVPATLEVTSGVDDVAQRGTLRYAVAHAGDGDTVLLTGAVNAGITLTQGQLLLKQQNLTIESASAPNPVTISGNGGTSRSRVFEVAGGASVTLSGLIVTGGNGRTGHTPAASDPPDRHEGRGGGIVVDEGATLIITGSIVTGNFAERGGGIADFGTLTVTGCTVSDNQAKPPDPNSPASNYGGGISVFSGAPFSPLFTATLAISDSTVSGNTARQNGGGIAGVSSTVTADHCVVAGNTAQTFDGGGLNNRLGTMTVRHTRVDDNHAPNGFGGGLFNNPNDPSTNSPAALSILDCDVDGDSARFGGGIANDGTLTLLDSRLVQNTTNSNYLFGGGVLNWFAATATMQNDVLTGNFAGAGGGVFSFGAVAMSDCTLSGNSAYNSGGAVSVSAGSLDAERCVFSHNSSYGGGAIENEGSTTIRNSKIDGNFTKGDYYQGGGILNYGALTISGSQITNNTAAWGGGIDNEYGTVSLSGCLLSGNSTTYADGGGILNFDTLTLDNCTVSDNHAGGQGGGVANYGLLTASDSTFSGNTPDAVFGLYGVYVDGGGNTGL